MKLGRVSFSHKGYEAFKDLSRKEQKKYLQERMPGHAGIDKLLKNIPSAKFQKHKKKTSKSQQSGKTKSDDGKNSPERSKSKAGKD